MTIRTPEKEAAFLHVLAETGNVSKACAAVGAGRTTVYDWREDSPEFREAWDKTAKRAVGVLRDEAHRRAVEGVPEPVFYQGTQCGTVQRYSDALLALLLKSLDRDTFGDRLDSTVTFDHADRLKRAAERADKPAEPAQPASED